MSTAHESREKGNMKTMSREKAPYHFVLNKINYSKCKKFEFLWSEIYNVLNKALVTLLYLYLIFQLLETPPVEE